MTISIVLSTYNGEQYIIEQLESLKYQSVQADEVLIFDDGSTDNTVQIIEDFISQNNVVGWKLIKNETNKGWKKNFIDGMDAASGDLIFTCDQDDIWSKSKLEIMRNVMIEHPEITVLGSIFYLYQNNESKIVKYKKTGELTAANYSSKLFFCPCPGCTLCTRRNFFSKILSYWKDEYAHDAFVWRFAMFSDSAYILHKPLIKWRRHSESTYTVDEINKRNYLDKLSWLDYAMRFLCDSELYVNTLDNNFEKLNVINKYKKWIAIRIRFYKKKNPLYGLRLIRYIKCYSSIKQYLGDWVITYIWSKKYL
ncbi:MAG: glycosyltransferase [Ruminococcus sp.]|nr:glycosyltransferase [Ruminococcus sp.]